MKKYTVLIVAIAVVAFVDEAFANRLVDAADRGTSEITAIVRSSSAIGVLIGAGLMSVGLSNIGKSILAGAVLGVFVSYAGKPIVELISGLF